MSKWLIASAVLVFSGIFLATEVEALSGGGRTVGAQRSDDLLAQTPAKPAQQQAAPAQQGAQQAAPGATGSRWAPILGGVSPLAGILGYLFGGSGLFGFLLLALLAIAAVVGVRALMRRRAERTAAGPPPPECAKPWPSR